MSLHDLRTIGYQCTLSRFYVGAMLCLSVCIILLTLSVHVVYFRVWLLSISRLVGFGTLHAGPFHRSHAHSFQIAGKFRILFKVATISKDNHTAAGQEYCSIYLEIDDPRPPRSLLLKKALRFVLIGNYYLCIVVSGSLLRYFGMFHLVLAIRPLRILLLWADQHGIVGPLKLMYVRFYLDCH